MPSQLPPSGIILPQNTVAGRTESGTGEASAISMGQLGGTGRIYTQAEFETLLGTGGPGYQTDPPHNFPKENDKDSYNKVVLEPGSIVEIDNYQHPRVYDFTWITSDPKNPATIKFKFKEADAPRSCLFCITGSNIILENLIFDFNHGPQYKGGAVCIRFAVASGTDPDPSTARDNITIRDCEFIDSDPPWNRLEDYSLPWDAATNPYISLDNWCINVSTGINAPVRNFQLLRCRHVSRPYAQLTSGGYEGIEGAVIKGNICDRCEAGSIQFTTAASVDPADMKYLRGISICDNICLRTQNTSISLGSDGSAPGGDQWQCSLIDCEIARNLIHQGPYNQFPVGPRMQCDGDGEMTNCSVIDNVVISQEARDYTQTNTRALNLLQSGNSGSLNPAEVVVSGNVWIGPVVHVIDDTITVVDARRDPTIESPGIPATYTVADRLVIGDMLQMTRTELSPDDNSIYLRGVELMQGASAPEETLEILFQSAESSSLAFKHQTIDASGQYADRDYVHTFNSIGYPNDGVVVFKAATPQRTVTFEFPAGNIFWADGDVPDFLTTIPALATVLIRWRYDKVNLYCSYEVMS